MSLGVVKYGGVSTPEWDDRIRSAEPQPWHRRLDGKALAGLVLLVLVAYLLTARYTVNQVNDTRETAMSAWALGTQGSLALPEEWPEDSLRWSRRGVDGLLYTDRFPGPVLWTAPFYSVAELISPRGTPPHPWLGNYAPAGVAAGVAGVFAIGTAFVVYRRIAGRRLAWLAAGSLALGTSMWSVGADAMWTHAIGSAFLLLGVLGTATRRYAWAGLAFGLAILCRPQLAVVPAVIGIWEGVRLRDLAPVVKMGSTSALGLVVMWLYSQTLFGTWLPVAGYSTAKVEAVASRPTSEFLEHVFFALLHPARGLLVYTPILLLLLPGVWRGWRIAPTWVRSSTVAGLVYALVQLRANGWYGGLDHFGSRLLLETLVLASPLLVLTFRTFVLPSPPALRRAFYAVLALSVALHGVGATIMETGLGGFDGDTFWQDQLTDLCEGQPDLCQDR